VIVSFGFRHFDPCRKPGTRLVEATERLEHLAAHEIHGNVIRSPAPKRLERGDGLFEPR
jgi:hypothetical protein